MTAGQTAEPLSPDLTVPLATAVRRWSFRLRG